MRGILAGLVLGFALLFVVSQVAAAFGYLNECEKRYADNELMLAMPSCKNPVHRARLETGGVVNCTKLELENRLGPYGCMVTRWWAESMPNQIYDYLRSNPVSTFLATSVVVLFSLYMTCTNWRDRAREQERTRMVTSIWKEVSGVLSPPSRPRLEEAPARRRHRIRIEELQDSEDSVFVPRQMSWHEDDQLEEEGY